VSEQPAAWFAHQADTRDDVQEPVASMKPQSVRDLKLQVALEVFAPHLNNLIARSRSPSFENFQLPAVPPSIGIGVGIGKQPGEFALAVRVKERLPQVDPLLQRIIALAHDEVDIVATGPVRPFLIPVDVNALRAPCRPLVIGCSIGHVTATAGTLGLIAQHTKTNRPVLVSNSHVLAHSGAAKVGDGITQPGRVDGGIAPIGALLDFAPLKPTGSNQVDAAIAVPDAAIELQPRDIPGIGNFTIAPANGLLPNVSVSKLGRTSGLTHGVVTAVEIDHIVMESELGNLTFDDQIEVRGTDRAFSDLGDSGALVVSDQNAALGLVFCGNPFANGGLGVTYVNPLPRVMDAFNLKPL
jgi:hypothetical protein